jgi:hypothetical protein
MAGSLQQLFASMEEDTGATRGPTEGLSPPRSKQRTGMEQDDEHVELDASQLGMVKVFKREMKVMLRETMDEQDEKFERRFDKVERKLAGFAKWTDQATANLKNEAEQSKTQLKTWQEEMEVKFQQREANVKQAMGKLPQAFSGGGGSGGGGVGGGVKPQEDEKTEKQQRTITFGTFPEDTKSESIKAFIDATLESVGPDIEEAFTYGKKFAERGAARFKTKAAMWKYMTENAGSHKHSFEGKAIYVNADGGRDRSDTDKNREKAVRKLVRTVIEKNGGDGKALKSTIDTNYTRGIVRWKDARIGEWDDGSQSMILKGMAIPFKEHFEMLMASK